LRDDGYDERKAEHGALVRCSSHATVVVGEQREQLGGRAARERMADSLDESRVADALEGGGEASLELVLALREGAGVERVLGHVTRQCNITPRCHRNDTMAFCCIGR